MQINFLDPAYLFQKVYEALVGLAFVPFLLELIIRLEELLAAIGRLSTTVSLVLLVGVGYALIRVRQIRKKENELFDGLVALAPAAAAGAEAGEPRNPKWEKVLEHIASPNPPAWRLAILEADILLDDLLDALHYRGESIGDKLKKIEASDFTSLDAAWEAHKIRNQVAHEGSEFLLSEREAKRVISLYEEVFREFRFV